jgi:hypothetical protein
MNLPPDPHYCHRFPAVIVVAMKIACDGTADSVTRLRRALPLLSSIMVRRRRYWAPMRQCGDGATNSAELSPIACAVIGHGGEDRWHMDLDTLVRSARWPCGQALLQATSEGFAVCVPRVIVTDKLRSYGVVRRDLLPNVEHRQRRYLNNRAENSHRPTARWNSLSSLGRSVGRSYDRPWLGMERNAP